jgi:hypothetical protein
VPYILVVPFYEVHWLTHCRATSYHNIPQIIQQQSISLLLYLSSKTIVALQLQQSSTSKSTTTTYTFGISWYTSDIPINGQSHSVVSLCKCFAPQTYNDVQGTYFWIGAKCFSGSCATIADANWTEDGIIANKSLIAYSPPNDIGTRLDNVNVIQINNWLFSGCGRYKWSGTAGLDSNCNSLTKSICEVYGKINHKLNEQLL